MQNHNDAIRTNGDSSFRKIYLSLYWKGFMWEGVGDRTELQHIDPHSYGHDSVSFPFSWAAQPETLRPSLSGIWSLFQRLLSKCNCSIGVLRAPLLGAGSLYRILTPNDLNFLSPGLYNNLTSTLLPVSVTISHSIQPLDSQGHILIFLDWMHLLFTQVYFLFSQLGRGQYATYRALKIFVQNRKACKMFENWSVQYIYIYIYIYPEEAIIN